MSRNVRTGTTCNAPDGARASSARAASRKYSVCNGRHRASNPTRAPHHATHLYDGPAVHRSAHALHSSEIARRNRDDSSGNSVCLRHGRRGSRKVGLKDRIACRHPRQHTERVCRASLHTWAIEPHALELGPGLVQSNGSLRKRRRVRRQEVLWLRCEHREPHTRRGAPHQM